LEAVTKDAINPFRLRAFFVRSHRVSISSCYPDARSPVRVSDVAKPGSPRIKTVESEEASLAIWRNTVRSASEELTMSSNIES
jgi:hypothetical protein